MTDQATWRKSSRSNGQDETSDCVELAPGKVRDSKNQSGPVLDFEPGALGSFLAGLKAGRFAR
ncbi:DUF397 domain-containing protein [Lentzea tibetensis]|uniref:DUF397 domain-containing protein n=1 Tax=Lentzea tibetensis TaxID=2591470 RepID=A0A563EKV1_9PSEU|nr:DUF397 domain-containing protein [Lentzea tibetensis]TWP47507.1 DUF397 domain-containing protein [Lentzea tibetensis]